MNPDDLNAWGKIHFICPCHQKNSNYSFDLIKKGGLIYYKCNNPNCKNCFSSDVHLKTMESLDKYIQEKGTPEGFTRYFREKDISFKTRYIETKKITNNYKTYIIEVIKMT